MKYNCEIINVDDYEVTIKIDGVLITGFVNRGLEKNIGDKGIVELILFDDLKISTCDDNIFKIERIDQTFEYSIFGRLNIDNGILKSVIDFEIEKEELYEYGYLDGKQVKVNVLRIDFAFE